MIDDLPLRWIVTGFFALSAAASLVFLYAGRRTWTSGIASGLHLVMAIAMAVMAWPWGAQLPTTGPAVFFLLAGIWFVMLTVGSARTLVQWATYSYHTLMMVAMSCMYLVMEGHCHGEWGAHTHASHEMSMPSTDMAAIDMLARSGPPGWITVLNGCWTFIFGLGTVFWAYRYFTQRHHGASRQCHLHSAGRVTMSAGMALTFGVLLFQI